MRGLKQLQESEKCLLKIRNRIATNPHSTQDQDDIAALATSIRILTLLEIERREAEEYARKNSNRT